MQILNHESIAELVSHRAPHCVSLYMPTHRTGRERQQDTIRLKNLLQAVRERLVEQMPSASAADRMLQPAAQLEQDDEFWRHRSDGLACFCAPEFFRAYRVPMPLDERWSVNERFCIRPLLPFLRSDARLHILSLTQESARLFEATKYSIREIELPEIARPELEDNEQALQYHAHQAPAQGKGATETAMYHGQGGAPDRAKKDATRFFQLVDRAVMGELRGQRTPLVLACVGYLASLYESANSYRHLIKGKVPGSPDRWSDEELRDHAWQIVAPHFRRKQEEAWQTFQQADTPTAEDVEQIVLAADQGRVGTLFLADGQQRWGHFDSQQQTVRLAEQDQEGEELLDYAASRTLGQGGEVFLFDSLPDTDAPAAATLRY